MTTKPLLLNLLLLAVLSCWSCTENSNKNSEIESSMNQASSFEKPKAKKVKKELSIHGDTRIDNYYWLNQREDPEVIAYLNQENDYTSNVMEPTKDFQQKLFDEIVGRIKKDDTSVPYLKNGYYYQTRYEKEKEYPIYIRRKGSLEGDMEVMLDANEEAKPYDFYNAGGLSVSPSNEILAYGEDTLSRRIYTIRFKNLTTGEMLDDVIL